MYKDLGICYFQQVLHLNKKGVFKGILPAKVDSECKTVNSC